MNTNCLGRLFKVSSLNSKKNYINLEKNTVSYSKFGENGADFKYLDFFLCSLAKNRLKFDNKFIIAFLQNFFLRILCYRNDLEGI